MIDSRPVIISGLVVLSARSGMTIKDLPQLRAKPPNTTELKGS
jgi:hypothetical protein